jgi:hypothetical protein
MYTLCNEQRTAPLPSLKLHKIEQNILAKKVGSGKIMQIRLDPESAKLRTELLSFTRRDLRTIGTVKAGNFVTFFAQINFFLKNALR